MADIMPVTICGAHVFHPLWGVTRLDAVATAPAPPFNDELLDQDNNDHADKEDSQDRNKENKVCLSYSVVYVVLTFDRLRLLFQPPLTFENVNVQPQLHPPPLSKKKKLTGAVSTIDGLSQSISAFSDKVCNVLAMDPSLCTPH